MIGLSLNAVESHPAQVGVIIFKSVEFRCISSVVNDFYLKIKNSLCESFMV